MILLASVAAISARADSRRAQEKVPPTEADAIKQQIIGLEQRWQRAVVGRDRLALDRLLATGFSEKDWIRPQVGLWRRPNLQITRRQEYIDSILKSDFNRYDIAGDITVNVVSGATASATFRLIIERRPRLVPLSGQFSPPKEPPREIRPPGRRGGDNVVDTWTKTNDGWRVSSRQVVLAAGGMIIPLT
jgi:hypothetical protein